MSLKNVRMGGLWVPDHPGHYWDAKPPAVKGVSSKPSNEKTMSLEELNEKNKPEFEVPNQGRAPRF